jgi:uncharacterized protein (TIGR03435 family)
MHLLLMMMLAQDFEAASIKISPPPKTPFFVGCKGGPETDDPSRLACTNIDPDSLVRRAYQLPYYMVEYPHAPDPTAIDLTATIPAGTTKEQFSVMLQHLLAERFHLTVHWEKRDNQTYDLTVAKNGPKMKKSSREPDPASAAQPWRMRLADDGFPAIPDNRPAFLTIRGRGRAGMESMSEFAASLSNTLRTSVTDSTGLTGRYDFTLSWAERDTDDGPPLIGAIEAQLGLKLVAKKGQRDVLVIDHLDTKPTEN